MKKQDSLHQLIHSLNSAEKRFFKLQVSANAKQSNYLKLFDLLNQQKVYNEQALIEKITDNSFSKNLKQNKKYLKSLLLQSICNYASDTPAEKVGKLLKEIRVLKEKALKKEVFRKIQKAKQIALQYELFGLAMEVIDIELRHLILSDFEKATHFFVEHKKMKEELSFKYNLLNNLYDSKFKSYLILLQKNRKSTQQEIENIKQEIAKYDIETIKAQNSFHIYRMYLALEEDYALLSKDFERNMKNCKHIYELFFAQYQHFQTDRSVSFVVAYLNYLSSIFYTGKFHLLPQVIDEGKNIPLTNEKDKVLFFQKMTSNKLSYYLNTGKINEAIILENEFEQGYKKYKNKIKVVDMLSIFYNFALIYFLNGKFEKCLDWLIRLDKLKQDLRKDIFADASIIKIICHFQLENYTLLESLVRSKRRSEKNTAIEKKLISAVFALARNKLNKKDILQNLAEQIEKQKESYKQLDYGAINIWIEAQMQNQTIQQAYFNALGLS